MNTLRTRAFTIVELMIVVIVISIIATMSILGYGSVQRDTRDSARSSKATVISEALEKYYDKNHEYPSVASLAGQSISTVKQKLNLQDDDTLVFPSGTANASAIVSSGPSSTRLVYAGSPGSASCQTDVNGYCDSFQLQYVTETTGATVAINNRQGSDYVAVVVPPTAPSAPVVSASGTSTTSINVSWGISSGTTPITYTVQYGTTTAYGSTACAATPATTCTLSGLTPSSSGTLYYVRVVATNSYGTASGTSSAYTNPNAPSGTAPSAPAVTATTQSSSSISVSWPASSGTAPISYSVSGSGNASSCTSSPCLVTGLAASTTYTFSVTASNAYGSATGSASATTSAPTPTCGAAPSQPVVSAAATTATSIQVSWSASSTPANCSAPTYTVSYGTTTSYGSTACSGISATSCSSMTGLAMDTLYYIKVTPTNSFGTGTPGTTSASTSPYLTASANAPNAYGRSTISWSYTLSGYTPPTTLKFNIPGTTCTNLGSTVRSCIVDNDPCKLALTVTVNDTLGRSDSATIPAWTGTKPTINVNGSTVSGNNIIVNWNYGGDITWVQLKKSKDGGAPTYVDFISEGSGGSGSYTIGPLGSGSWVVTVAAANCRYRAPWASPPGDGGNYGTANTDATTPKTIP